MLCKNGFISRRKFVLSEGTDKTDGFLSSADNRNLTRADKNQKDAYSKMFSMRSLRWEALRIITGAKAGSNSACNMKKRLEKTKAA